ncbi:MAG: hypothetical protein AAFY56_16445, partial [Pseudomonadota bacterium]
MNPALSFLHKRFRPRIRTRGTLFFHEQILARAFLHIRTRAIPNNFCANEMRLQRSRFFHERIHRLQKNEHKGTQASISQNFTNEFPLDPRIAKTNPSNVDQIFSQTNSHPHTTPQCTNKPKPTSRGGAGVI